MSQERLPFQLGEETLYGMLNFSDLSYVDSQQAIDQMSVTPAGSQAPHEFPVSQPAEIPGTAEQNVVVQGYLQLRQGGAPLDQILSTIQTYNNSIENGIQYILHNLSQVPPDVLREIERTYGPYLPPNVAGPVSLSREFFEDSDEESTPVPRDTKRGCKMSKNKGSKPKYTQSGCPGDNWTCTPEEMEKRDTWTSFKAFKRHYITHHIEAHREDGLEGGRIKCHQCKHASFPGDGLLLTKHIFFDDMKE